MSLVFKKGRLNSIKVLNSGNTMLFPHCLPTLTLHTFGGKKHLSHPSTYPRDFVLKFGLGLGSLKLELMRVS